MDFNTLDKQMRRFEQSLDRTMLEGIYVVARLDGHGFTRLTKKEWDLEKPFDVRFRDAMIVTTKHLVDCGFRIIYGYTQSDEISLLFHLNDDTFGRKERKLVSILAAEASVAFSMHAGKHAVFDCRLVPLPTRDHVVDYFRWRQEDAHRNSLNSHCYWALRKDGVSADEAQKRMSGISNSEKNEILFERGINYNDLPSWQKRGIGLFYLNEQRQGFNPVTKETTLYTRRALHVETELPIGQEYSQFLYAILEDVNKENNRSNVKKIAINMKMQMTRGCIADSLTIDGKEEIDLTDDERQEVLQRIFEHLKPKDLNYVLQDLVETFGDYESDDEPCETCGDYVETYTWEI